MPRRIDVELTSARDDGTWTWRAAGAKQPKGVVAADLLYDGARVGDVLSAEAEFDIDGITITSVTPPKQKAGRSDLLELAGPGDDFQPVVTNWTERAGGRDRDPYGDHAARGDRPGGGRGGPGGDRGGRGGPRPTADWRAKVTPPASPDRGEPRGDRGGARRGAGGRERDRGGRDRERTGDRGERTGAGPGQSTGAGGARGTRGERPDTGAAPRRDRPGRGPGAGGRGERGDRGDRPGGDRTGPGGAADRPRPKRLSPGSTHRNAVLESLSPEQRPVAEHVLRGGIPAVRRAIQEQNAAAKESGQHEIKPGPLVALAEELLPRLKTAEWRDRAEAAMADVDQIGLRDLRSVVSGADAAARDDETRSLAVQLREALEGRLKKLHDDWVAEITSALDESRLVRALRVSARPPDPSMRFPSELALRLSSTASGAMAADTPADRWAALLEAVAASPVRTTVKPAALPNDASEALLQSARQQAGRIPALTTLLGISMPPPPGPVRRIPPKPSRPVPPPPRPRSTPPAPPSAAAEGAAAVSEAPEPPAVIEQDPAPPTPVNDEPPSPIPTSPAATEPIPPVEPTPAPADADVEAPGDVSVTAEDSGPGASDR